MLRLLFVAVVLLSLVLAREATAKELSPQIVSADPLGATAIVALGHEGRGDEMNIGLPAPQADRRQRVPQVRVGPSRGGRSERGAARPSAS